MNEVVKLGKTEAGLVAAVVLVRDGSHHCAYVAVPEGHPCYGKEYSDEVPELKELFEKQMHRDLEESQLSPMMVLISDGETPRMDVAFQVHGGVTYSSFSPSDDPEDGYPVSDKAWADSMGIELDGNPPYWIGFDAAHSGDQTRGLGMMMGFPGLGGSGGVWRDEFYMWQECEKLAQQLASVMPEAKEEE